MKKNTTRKTILLFTLLAFCLSSCQKDDSKEAAPLAKGKYENGFFIINEGWFGHGTGEVNFYSYDTGKLTDSIFKRENPTKDLNPASSTLQSGTIYKDNMYLVSKVGGPMVVVDPYTFKEKGRIDAKGGNDWRAFLGIDENTGLLSSSSGVYMLNLKTLSTSSKLVGADGQIGDMLKAGKYIFMHSATNGMLIFNADDYSLNQKMKNVTMGFAQTPNGKVWYTGGKYLYQIDPQTLIKDSVDLKFTTYAAWGAWHPSSIVASTKENAVYILKNASFSGGSEVYKYVYGNSASIDVPFITNPAKQIFYGKGIGFDSRQNQVIIQTVQSGFGANFAINHLFFYDTVGNLKKTLAYDGYYFPSITVFNP
jgi:hypothetical protein